MGRFSLTSSVVLLLATVSAFAQNTNNVQSAAAKFAQEYANASETPAEVTKPKYWTNSLGLDLGLTSTTFQVWAAGGSNNITFKVSADAKLNYKKDLASWNNRIQLTYGFICTQDESFLLKANNDRIYVESKFAYKTSSNSTLSYSAFFDYKTQFDRAYSKYVIKDGYWDRSYLKSAFMSPGYTNVGLGIDWKPNVWLTVNMAPLTGGFTICTISDLRKSYGMEQKEDGSYRSARFQFGAQIKADARFIINNNLNIESQLVLFSDYLNRPQNFRVNWDNKIALKLGRFFSIVLNTWLIYDPVVLIKDTDEAKLKEHPNGRQQVQIKEYLSINFSYTFK